MRIFDTIARLLDGKNEPVHAPKAKVAGDADRDLIFANPERYTRASRRTAGYKKPVWDKLMRAKARDKDGFPQLTRYTRRHINALFTSSPSLPRRVRKQRARIRAAFNRRGLTWA